MPTEKSPLKLNLSTSLRRENCIGACSPLKRGCIGGQVPDTINHVTAPRSSPFKEQQEHHPLLNGCRNHHTLFNSDKESLENSSSSTSSPLIIRCSQMRVPVAEAELEDDSDEHFHPQVAAVKMQQKAPLGHKVCKDEHLNGNHDELTSLHDSQGEISSNGNLMMTCDGGSSGFHESSGRSRDPHLEPEGGPRGIAISAQNGWAYLEESDFAEVEMVDEVNDSLFLSSNMETDASLEEHVNVLHPLLKKEVSHFQEQYGEESVVKVEVSDMAAITLKIEIDFLDASIASAWFFKPNDYILLKLVFQNMLFLDGLPPKVSIIHQFGPSMIFPVGRQLEKILQRFFNDLWPILTNKTLEKVLNEHLMNCKCGSLRELLSLGFAESDVIEAFKQCGGSVSEAASYLIDKGGLSQSQMSNGSSQEGEVNGLPNGTSNGKYGDSHQSAKPTRLKNMLGVFIKFISRSAENSNNNSNKQLSLSLNNLSAEGSKAKEVPPLGYGLLNQVYTYVKNRILTINEFCVICDEPHVFQTAEWQYMLKPSVCSRELCCFSHQQMGVMNEATDTLATGAEVTDLLVALAKAALKSKRREIIFDPYPTIVDPNNRKEFVLHPKRKNFALVESLFDKFEEIGFNEFIDNHHFQQKLMEVEPLLYPLISWLVMSNRSHIVKIPAKHQLSFMHTPHQFLLLSSAPSKEKIFQQAKKNEMQGSYFAFHGSLIENWHSILRSGLLVGTGTKHQVHGAAYGRGIYLSPLSSVSYGYSNCGHGEYNGTDLPVGSVLSKTQTSNGGQRNRFISGKNITCIALCEVINSSTCLQRFQNVWVCSNPDLVCTRFFFVYEDGQVGDQLVDTMLPKFKNEIETALRRMSGQENTNGGSGAGATGEEFIEDVNSTSQGRSNVDNTASGAATQTTSGTTTGGTGSSGVKRKRTTTAAVVASSSNGSSQSNQ